MANKILGAVGGLIGGGCKKKSSSSTSASTPAATASGPIIAQLSANSSLRRKPGQIGPSIRLPRNIQTILSDKLGA